MMDAPRPRSLLFAFAVLFLVGLNLRLSLAGFTPLIPFMQAETALSNTALGVATGAAVAMFGVMAPFTPRLIARFGADRVLTAGLIVITVGSVARSAAIFVGMLIIGAGIGLMNVVLPAIIKRDFPHRMALATAVYTSALNVGSAAAAMGAVPVASALGSWQVAAAMTAIPAICALIGWAFYDHRSSQSSSYSARAGHGLWRNAIAWQVTAFMGLQSLLYYFILAWLPSIYRDAGMSAAQAGTVLAVAQLGQLVGCIATPFIVKQRRDLRGVLGVAASLTLAGYLGFTFGPMSMPYVFALILGIGQGGALVNALLLIVLRAPDTDTASSLSGMSQSLGYLVAALGPPVAGLLFETWGGWTLPLLIMCALCLIEALVGLYAGRDRIISSTREITPAEIAPEATTEITS